MRTILLVAALMSGVSAATVGAQTPAPPPMVAVGIYSSLDNGTPLSAAFTTGQKAADSLASLVYGTACSTLGAGLKTPPVGTTHAWRLAGRVLSITTEQAVIQLEWQRVLSDGQAVTGPGQSVELTLAVGDRVTLDSVNWPAAENCRPTVVELAARFVPRSAYRFSMGGAATAAGAAVAGGRSGGGGQAGGGGQGRARATRSHSSRPESGAGDGGGVAGGGVDAARIGTSTCDVDLWLVHGAPNHADEVLHETIRATPAGAAFAFAPIRIATPQGALTVRVRGSVAIAPAATAGRQFVFAADRQVAFAPSNRPGRDQAPEAEGGTRITSPLPGPDDVVSYEMPPLRLLSGGPSVADRFAIRVRVTPVKLEW